MPLVVRGARLVDVSRQEIVADVSVRVEDGVISRVDRGSNDLVGDGDAVLDADGRYLLPGLIDSHVHVRGGMHRGPSDDDPNPVGHSDEADEHGHAEALARLAGFLYCGVTSVFDAGNNADMIFSLRGTERAGRCESPRIYCTGAFVTATGGHGSNVGSATNIDALPADLPELRAHLARQPDLLKITYDEHNWGVRPLIPILTIEVLRGIIAAAHEEMTRVTVHVSNEAHAREAVACGADALAHPVIQSPATDEFCWLLAAKGIPIASTLAIGERYARLADDPAFLDDPWYRHCLTDDEYDELRGPEHERQRANRWADWMRVMTPVAQDNIRRLVAAGGVVAAGSDLSLGPDFHRELELLADAGLSAWDVLRSATVNGARYLGRSDALGDIAPGKLGDMLLVDEDPTSDVTRLRTTSVVVKNGVVVDRDALATRAG